MKLRYLLVPLGVALLFFYIGYVTGRWQEVPGETDSWKDLAQPVAVVGAGFLALLAGLAGLFGVLESSRRVQEDNRLSRERIEEDNRLSRERIEEDNRASRERIEEDNRASREQIETENLATRNREERSERLNRCWERFTWVVEHTSGHGQGSEIFPPESVSEVVHTLVEEARMLDDGTLVAALTEYQKVVAEEFAASLDLASEPAETQNGSEDEI